MRDKQSLEAAKDTTVRFLSYRARSEMELKRYLNKKGFPEEITDAVLSWVREYHLVDDKQFANSWVENRKLLKPMGKRRLVQELREKGISGEIIASSLEDYQDEQEYQIARKMVEDKLNRALKIITSTKVINWLVRRGFAVSISVKVVEELLENNQEHGKLLKS